MTDWFLGLVPVYGLWLIALVTFASCLALPMPASVVMLAAGGFAASGDLVLWHVVAAAILGAVHALHAVIRLPPAVAMQPPAPPVPARTGPPATGSRGRARW